MIDLEPVEAKRRERPVTMVAHVARAPCAHAALGEVRGTGTLLAGGLRRDDALDRLELSDGRLGRALQRDGEGVTP